MRLILVASPSSSGSVPFFKKFWSEVIQLSCVWMLKTSPRFSSTEHNACSRKCTSCILVPLNASLLRESASWLSWRGIDSIAKVGISAINSFAILRYFFMFFLPLLHNCHWPGWRLIQSRFLPSVRLYPFLWRVAVQLWVFRILLHCWSSWMWGRSHIREARPEEGWGLILSPSVLLKRIHQYRVLSFSLLLLAALVRFRCGRFRYFPLWSMSKSDL